MKDLKDLYKILLKFYIKQPNNYICNTIELLFYNGVITAIEMGKLQTHFRTQLPTETLHTEFYNNKLFSKPIHVSDAWFTLANKPRLGKRVRIDFISKILSTL
jgi:hypothetical protein